MPKNYINLVNIDGSPYEGAYQTALSAGVDLITTKPLSIYPNKEPIMVHTGVKIDNNNIRGMFGLLTLRSSMRKKGLSIMGVGIIDIDYSGEIIVPVIYNGPKSAVMIKEGERMFQLVLTQFKRFDNVKVNDIERGEGGFGSTG